MQVLPSGDARVGISSYAQSRLGGIVFVELPKVGQAVDAGQAMGMIEPVKAATGLYAPVVGTVVAVNDELAESPELVNEDPYGDGWLVEFRMQDPMAVNELLSAEKYRGLVAED